MRAIDLYSGIGGWAIGLKLAGIDVVNSYEYWEPAVRTHNGNLKGTVSKTDIRELKKSDLPSAIDIVVGSPPCTQFSLSNRGGQGDIADGLKDIHKFFQIIRWLKPRYWAFENVPRVRHVIEEQSKLGGALFKFSDIIEKGSFRIIDFSHFGVPQKRKRCIGGNFDFELLQSYGNKLPIISLGAALDALHNRRTDPVYKSSDNLDISDMEDEEYFTDSEIYYNRASKINHPVYNRMSFPENLNAACRTVTATCTRVSRESVVIEAPEYPGKFRRLNVRERLSMQSFPTSYIPLSNRYAEKLKMAGNAIPPAFTYLVANAMLKKHSVSAFPSLKGVEKILKMPNSCHSTPDKKSKKYRANRRFRFSIPHLNFKSGTQFELSNDQIGENWSIKFFFGNSKFVRKLELSSENANKFEAILPRTMLQSLTKNIISEVPVIDSKTLQLNWTSETDQIIPLELVTKFGELSKKITIPSKFHGRILQLIDDLAEEPSERVGNGVGVEKVSKYIKEVSAGIFLGLIVNSGIIHKP